ncbi:hypothetical protein CHS0354_040314 [Potamilus streckersoni]|uniref:Uncharacterized protein n=1 Tax=Potamilus streckersoni TaxID=2493646 RepID=A0AAE0SH58_9BIVA|nr:hypothetical protein CHS0354_040314 [Potamilus streckersoni]
MHKTMEISTGAKRVAPGQSADVVDVASIYQNVQHLITTEAFEYQTLSHVSMDTASQLLAKYGVHVMHGNRIVVVEINRVGDMLNMETNRGAGVSSGEETGTISHSLL